MAGFRRNVGSAARALVYLAGGSRTVEPRPLVKRAVRSRTIRRTQEVTRTGHQLPPAAAESWIQQARAYVESDQRQVARLVDGRLVANAKECWSSVAGAMQRRAVRRWRSSWLSRLYGAGVAGES
jgi:hypothetical protein